MMAGKQDLLGLMMEAAAGHHSVDMKRELTTDILKEQEEEDVEGVAKAKAVRLKPGKFLMTGQHFVVDTQLRCDVREV